MNSYHVQTVDANLISVFMINDDRMEIVMHTGYGMRWRESLNAEQLSDLIGHLQKVELEMHRD